MGQCIVHQLGHDLTQPRFVTDDQHRLGIIDVESDGSMWPRIFDLEPGAVLEPPTSHVWCSGSETILGGS